MLDVPPADAVIVLLAWHWGLSDTRRQAIERWVEAGGRLVVDGSLIGERRRFRTVVGHRRTRDARTSTRRPKKSCARRSRTSRVRTHAEGAQRTALRHVERRLLSHIRRGSFTRDSAHPRSGRSADESGIQAVRVRVGRGSVTVINATPFIARALFDGDHGWLFVAATQIAARRRVALPVRATSIPRCSR